jgi:cob(I)alamin adenosyltransferase
LPNSKHFPGCAPGELAYYTLCGGGFSAYGYNPSMAAKKTHKGDDGTTSVLGGERLPKYHPRIETLGSLDEASAALGLARALCVSQEAKSTLMHIQRDLYTIMAEVATDLNSKIPNSPIKSSRVEWLEKQMDALSAFESPISEFILPGDTIAGGALSLARTIIRRAERRLTELFATGEISNPNILKYINRLSTLCFSLELHENSTAGVSTTRAKK